MQKKSLDMCKIWGIPPKKSSNECTLPLGVKLLNVYLSPINVGDKNTLGFLLPHQREIWWEKHTSRLAEN